MEGFEQNKKDFHNLRVNSWQSSNFDILTKTNDRMRTDRSVINTVKRILWNDHLLLHNNQLNDLILCLIFRNNLLREITVRIKDKDYIDFQTAANNSGLKVDEKISEIIQYYIIIERNRKRFTQSTLFSTRTIPES